MNFHGYELMGNWENSTCGQIVKARKGEKKYFIKKYQTPVAPLDNGFLDAKTIRYKEKIFNDYVNYRERINKEINGITGPGGNIIVPCDSFVEGNQYVEVTEFIEGAVSDKEQDDVLRTLSSDEKILLMKTVAGALSAVHGKKIVHSDLKPKNILLVKNSSGNYVAKLIDFDNSYYVDKKPEDIVGDTNYYSPELGLYSPDDENREELADRITEKSDIFSLGLILHRYLTGELPRPVSLTEELLERRENGRIIYCWVALNNGCKLELSPTITNKKYSMLIADMLSFDPKDRPSAAEVLKRLNDPDDTEEKKDSSSSVSSICTPWSEHDIIFDKKAINEAGFVSVVQKELNGLKGYVFKKNDDTKNFLKLENLLLMKFAVKNTSHLTVDKTVTDTVTSDENSLPWPEHGIVFDKDTIRESGYDRVMRENIDGKKVYRFIKSDGKDIVLPVQTVIVMGLAKKF